MHELCEALLTMTFDLKLTRVTCKWHLSL